MFNRDRQATTTIFIKGHGWSTPTHLVSKNGILIYRISFPLSIIIGSCFGHVLRRITFAIKWSCWNSFYKKHALTFTSH